MRLSYPTYCMLVRHGWQTCQAASPLPHDLPARQMERQHSVSNKPLQHLHNVKRSRHQVGSTKQKTIWGQETKYILPSGYIWYPGAILNQTHRWTLNSCDTACTLSVPPRQNQVAWPAITQLFWMNSISFVHVLKGKKIAHLHSPWWSTEADTRAP